MRNSVAMGILTCVLFLTGGASGQEEKKPTKNPEGNWAFSKAEGGVKLAVSAPVKSSAGVPIALKVELVNKSKETVRVGINRREYIHVDLDLVDSDGKKVPLT